MDIKKESGWVMATQPLSFLLVFVNGHFIDEVLATTELIDDEEHVADVNRNTTLEVVVEVDVATK